MGHTDTGYFYFLITKHGSGAVSAQFANSQTSTVYFVSGRLRKNASAACFSASPMTLPLLLCKKIEKTLILK